MSDVETLLREIKELDVEDQKKLIESLRTDYPDLFREEASSPKPRGKYMGSKVERRAEIEEWFQDHANSDGTIDSSEFEDFHKRFGNGRQSFGNWKKELGFTTGKRMPRSSCSIDADEPCALNAISQELQKLTSQEVINHLTPKDRNSLKNELHEAIKRIDDSNRENGNES